ncbi:hypothetical protein BC829DRAFT_399768 [Chytridium lagenaria]|nr:hypothetical protein BC829DRAFT_399768 [Chytridium lagenaria]
MRQSAAFPPPALRLRHLLGLSHHLFFNLFNSPVPLLHLPSLLRPSPPLSKIWIHQTMAREATLKVQELNPPPLPPSRMTHLHSLPHPHHRAKPL